MRQVPDHVLSHWFQPLDNFATSASDFYVRVEAGIRERQIPEARMSRVRHLEAGIGSPEREYLRVEGRGYVMDVCAAPYGRGFFFSSWLTAPPVSWWIRLVWLLLSVVSWYVLFGLCVAVFGLGSAPAGIGGIVSVLTRLVVAYGVSVVAWFVGLHLIVRARIVEEQIVLAVPIIGAVYARIFAPTTYYKLDTARMMGSLIHTAVLEAYENVTEGKGVRALTEAERKPVMHSLLG